MQTIEYKYINSLKYNLVNIESQMLTFQNVISFIINKIFRNKKDKNDEKC